MPLSFSDGAAEPDAAAGLNAQVIQPRQFTDDLAATIRRFCKYRKVMTIEQLAARAGIRETRMAKLIHNDLLERKQATGSELLSIWSVLRAAAANESLAAIGMVAADDESAAEDPRLALAVADLFDAGADLAHITVDGVIKPAEADAALAACDRAEEKVDELRRAAKKARTR